MCADEDPTTMTWCIAHLKDLKASDVKYTDEVLLFVLGVQRLVDASDQPVEHSYVDGLCQRRHSVDHLRSAQGLIRTLLARRTSLAGGCS